ncbi:PREDICTED: serine/threonine-protein phosphatase 1 regulatory subunit 10-like [Lepidothrix coronata]|uniref:Serine/threonine-protein phosphatase 1 regulatory subunit 10-like n=1 Tax=Lepidothrix coronata TaxID=321398 RepID=A0A6J0GG66_9PASS|nr:PREDICTED: serine/threonine-protein phosphatase 1 regulatory subunit 10-like [Lepidothrix coronata]
MSPREPRGALRGPAAPLSGRASLRSHRPSQGPAAPLSGRASLRSHRPSQGPAAPLSGRASLRSHRPSQGPAAPLSGRASLRSHRPSQGPAAPLSGRASLRSHRPSQGPAAPRRGRAPVRSLGPLSQGSRHPPPRGPATPLRVPPLPAGRRRGPGLCGSASRAWAAPDGPAGSRAPALGLSCIAFGGQRRFWPWRVRSWCKVLTVTPRIPVPDCGSTGLPLRWGGWLCNLGERLQEQSGDLHTIPPFRPNSLNSFVWQPFHNEVMCITED